MKSCYCRICLRGYAFKSQVLSIQLFFIFKCFWVEKKRYLSWIGVFWGMQAELHLLFPQWLKGTALAISQKVPSLLCGSTCFDHMRICLIRGSRNFELIRQKSLFPLSFCSTDHSEVFIGLALKKTEITVWLLYNLYLDCCLTLQENSLCFVNHGQSVSSWVCFQK